MTLEIKIDKNRSVPVYQQIKQHLLELIGKEKLQAGAMMPNVKSVADAAGVSLRTADQALQALIDDGICYRRPKKGTFIREQEKSEPRLLCGIWSKYNPRNIQENILFSKLYQGISQAAIKNRFDASMIFNNPEQAICLYSGIDTFDFRGLVIPEMGNFAKALELAVRFPNKKFIFLNYRIKGISNAPPNVYAVVNDDYGGAYRLLEHYIAGGYRKILFINWKLPNLNDITYYERMRGFKQAAADYNLNLDIIECENPESSHENIIRTAYLAAARYLKDKNPPEVVVTANDFMAEGVKQYLNDEKLSGKIQLSGYDGLDHELSGRSGFSTVEVKYDIMGATAINLLGSDDSRNMPRIIKIEPQLNIIKSQESSC